MKSVVGLRGAFPHVTRRSYFSFQNVFSDFISPQKSYMSSEQDRVEIQSITGRPHTLFPSENGMKSQMINGQYVCSWSTQTEKKIMDVLKYYFSSSPKLTAFDDLDISKTLTQLTVDTDRIDNAASAKRSTITWIGHATSYYQTDGVYFLTDPIWSERASPSQYIGPKRYVAPPVDLNKLKVDIVLLSHTHYDHYDEPTARQIGNKALWIVPLGVKMMLEKIGITNCIELDRWDSIRYTTPSQSTIQVVFTPTKHWTSRTFFDRNTSLWGGFVVLSDHARYFFCGDTAYCPVFKEIGALYGPFDLASIPIGAYSPRWFLKDVHCDPTEALQIHCDLKAKRSMAIHWGTFPMSHECFIEPALELAKARRAIDLSHEHFFTMAHGETVEVGGTTSLPSEASAASIDDMRPRHDVAVVHKGLYEKYLSYSAYVS
jgi:N-acyl-phosphatidylethanolamine-hydrolysing phospholipase D